MNIFEGREGVWLRWGIISAVVLLAAFLLVQTMSALVGLRYIGTGVAAANTISVSGHGEDLAVPDIATFSFSVVSDEATVAGAQADATAVANAITAYLTGAGVDTKDIQTSGYSIEPQYTYQNAACPMSGQVPTAPTPDVVVNSGGSSGSGTSSGAIVYCPPGKQTLTGYEVSQSTTVKVRDTSKAGDLLAGVGSKGATEVSGLTFTFDDPTAVQTEARNKAIADAKSKAEALAQQLGVTLVRVVSFSENAGGSYPQPVAYSMAAGSGGNAATAPVISPGQNTTTDDVTITYEIK
ncbi:MAG: SIMPL domain-containing protein [Minisyncoccia bacterium]|jgi:hypothetical protein